MKVQILGTGCAKCKQLTQNAEAAVKVTQVREIADFGVMFTPALAIDDQVKAAGKALDPRKIAELLKQHTA